MRSRHTSEPSDCDDSSTFVPRPRNVIVRVAPVRDSRERASGVTRLPGNDAISRGDVVKSLLRTRVRINAVTHVPRSPRHFAARNNADAIDPRGPFAAGRKGHVDVTASSSCVQALSRDGISRYRPRVFAGVGSDAEKVYVSSVHKHVCNQADPRRNRMGEKAPPTVCRGRRAESSFDAAGGGGRTETSRENLTGRVMGRREWRLRIGHRTVTSYARARQQYVFFFFFQKLLSTRCRLTP